MRAPQGLCADFADADPINLAFFDQPRKRTHRLLDLLSRVHPVDIIEVDPFHPEALQRSLAGPTRIGGAHV